MKKQEQDEDYELIYDLIKKTILNNNEQNDELINLLAKNKHSDELIENISSKENFKKNSEMLDEAYAKRGTSKLLERINKDKRKTHIRIYATVSTVAAALFVISFYLFAPTKEYAIVKSIVNDYTETTLIVDNKDVIKLENDKTVVVKNSDNIAANGTDSRIVTQRLIVPTGKTHTILLEDSTEVTLNSCSELIYPSSFAENERRVILKGEAYFSVKKSTKPFIVEVDNSYIKVYGTEFNINAYTNQVKTVLVQGSVGVGGDGMIETKIVPNQMAIVDLTSRTQKIENVDVNSSLAWIDSRWEFLDENFENVIIELNKWYNVEFKYDKSLFKDVKISFISQRTHTISEVIDLIEKITDIKFIKENMKGGYYSIELSTK